VKRGVFEKLDEPFAQNCAKVETRAALALVKGLVRSSVLASDVIDERALALVGAGHEEIEAAIAKLREELHDELAACNPAPSPSRVNAYAFAAGKLIRDRLKEIEPNGSGRA
jgi:hypothetical protein